MACFVMIPSPSVNDIVVNGAQINKPVYLTPSGLNFSKQLPNISKGFPLNLDDGNYAELYTSCVHNGEIHIFGTSVSRLNHYKYNFDDGVWTPLNDIPGDANFQISHLRAFSVPIDGKLHIFDVYINDNFREYVWDETNDTWSLPDDLGYMPASNSIYSMHKRDITMYHQPYNQQTMFYMVVYDESSEEWRRYFKVYHEDPSEDIGWRYSTKITRFTLRNSKGIMVPLLNDSGYYDLHYVGVNQDGKDHVGYPNGLYTLYNKIAPYGSRINQAFVMNNNIYVVMDDSTIKIWNQETDTWTKVADMPSTPSMVETIGDKVYLLGGDTSTKMFRASDMMYKLEFGN